MSQLQALVTAVTILLSALVSFLMHPMSVELPSLPSLSPESKMVVSEKTPAGDGMVLGGTVENFPTLFVNGLKIGLRTQSIWDTFGSVSTTANITQLGSFNTYVSTTMILPPNVINSTTAASSTAGLGYQQSGTQMQGGLETIITSSTFNFASTTLGCVKNPFYTTSTIDLAQIQITGHTTTSWELYFVTTTNGFINVVNQFYPTGPVSSSANIINSVQVPSTTYSSSTNAQPVFVNGVNELGQLPQQVNYNYAGLAGTAAGSDIVSSTYNNRIPVAPNEFECLYATSTNIGNGTSGVINIANYLANVQYNASNTFMGNFILRWFR